MRRLKYFLMNEETGGEGGVGGTGEGSSDSFDMKGALDEISGDLFPETLEKQSESDESEDTSTESTEDGEKKDDETTIQSTATSTTNPTATDTSTTNQSASVAPNTWKKEALAEWSNIPEAAKQEILRRESEIHQGIEGYRAAAQVGDTFYNIAKDYTQNLESRGMKALDVVRSFFQVEHTLANGTNDQKVEMLQRMANEYGIILDGNGNYSFQDDSVQELKREVQALKQQENERVARQNADTQAKISDEINKFASDPINEHFNTVANDMAELIKANRGMTLKEAYDKAIWMNPTTRAIELEKEQKKVEEKRKEEVAKAKKLSSVNLGSSGDVKKGKVTGSWEDNLARSYDEIVSRI